MQKKLVSIIIPIYNVEEYLQDCLNSLINQTYRKIEIILIDDGSTDRSSNIYSQFLTYTNIKVIKQKNQGVSNARNNGIKVAKGEYIIFIDPDDIVSDRFVEILVATIEKSNTDLVYSGYSNELENVLYLSGNDKNNLKIKSAKYVENKILKNTYVDGYVWNKIFKSKIIHENNIKFPDKITIWEDLYFVIKYIKKCKSIAFISNKLYFYRLRNNSAVTSGNNFKKIKDKCVVCEKLLNEFNINNKTDFYRDLRKIYANNLVDFLYNLPSDSMQFNSYLSRRITFIRNNITKLSLKNFIKFMKIQIKYKEMRKKMKKIGILTINDDTNLGNRLQNYAVQETLKKFTDNVETIENKKIKKYQKLRTFIGDIIKSVSPKPFHKRYIRFAKFNKKIKTSKIIIYENNVPKDLKDKYDYFITGSDQVWNPNFARLTSIDLLSFANPNQKISFSASFGVNELPEDKKEFTKKNLETFKAISVREDAGKKIVEDLTGRKDVQVLVDPTMLLSIEDWDKVSKKPEQLKTDKYILNYFLGELSEKRKAEIDRIAKEDNCEVINILDKNSPFYCTGPSEFLYLERHAFLVCTDSFHSSVFAILYNRPFIVFSREDGTVPMNSRIETLINKFNLKNREYNGKEITKENLNHDYTEAYKILEEERKKTIKFLRQALDIEE